MSVLGGQGRKLLADIVFERMQRAIKSGAYDANERLPTEHGLAAEFEVSRPVIREALRRLREQGLVESRQGAGSFVRAIGLKEPLGFGRLDDGSDLTNCYEFRRTLEPEVAALAALRHDACSLSAIALALEMMRAAAARSIHREDADYQFHLAIAHASGNEFFSTALEALKEHIALAMRQYGVVLDDDRQGLANFIDEHRAIYEAIRDRNSGEARRLMAAHLILPEMVPAKPFARAEAARA
ncbi:FadR/GntR family transcriptional regulator [Paracoccus aminophilus]|uniref:Transcriptional regulator, GntR family n=1 Tax=Paracoccus aminophilus JCM 7686 TaxID=1367847 RepID=S5YPS4_PARAH|nr:FadR/GntR family transcriptional regulator [Paracoccus aminophilus]AGT07306.1 transcriptional regulator, GntR family [Paracoccus aminophilus JCM 7686]